MPLCRERCYLENGNKPLATVEGELIAVNDITDNGDNTYTFTMPGENVTVTAKAYLSADAILTGTPLAGATVKELLTTSNLDGEGVLTLNFSDNLTAIEAGKPYIVKWSKDAGYDANPSNFDLVNPVFNGVTVSDDTNNVAFTGGSFKGTYEKMAFEAEDKSILFVGAGNNLYWPKPSGDNIPSLGACRAYFQLDFDAVGPGGGGVREFVLNFGDEEQPLSISPVGERTEAFPQEGLDGVWYSLDGRKLSGKPTQKGLYIHGGKKVVIP